MRNFRLYGTGWPMPRDVMPIALLTISSKAVMWCDAFCNSPLFCELFLAIFCELFLARTDHVALWMPPADPIHETSSATSPKQYFGECPKKLKQKRLLQVSFDKSTCIDVSVPVPAPFPSPSQPHFACFKSQTTYLNAQESPEPLHA